jgi:hypothetical protein
VYFIFSFEYIRRCHVGFVDVLREERKRMLQKREAASLNLEQLVQQYFLFLTLKIVIKSKRKRKLQNVHETNKKQK